MDTVPSAVDVAAKGARSDECRGYSQGAYEIAHDGPLSCSPAFELAAICACSLKRVPLSPAFGAAV